MATTGIAQTIPDAGRPATPSERRSLVSANQRLAGQLRRTERAAERNRVNHTLLRNALIARLNANPNISDQELVALVDATARDAAGAQSAIDALRTQATALTDPVQRAAAGQVVARADASLAAGRLSDARRALAEVRIERLRIAHQNRDSESIVAWLYSVDAEAKVAQLEGDYDGAAALYLEASREGPILNHPTRLELARRAGRIYWSRADSTGHTPSLERAIQIMRDTILPIVPRATYPIEWAGMQNDIGLALHDIANGERSIPRFEQAIAAYRAALEAYEGAKDSFRAAHTLMNLANTQLRMAELRRSTPGIEEAIRNYHIAMHEIIREREPVMWSLLQMDIGVAIFTISQWEPGTARIEAARDALREALSAITAADEPGQWTLVQRNMAAVLAELGRRTENPRLLEEAIATYDDAIRLVVREAEPYKWASMILIRTETALDALRRGWRTDPVAVLVEAVRTARAVGVDLADTGLQTRADRLLGELTRRSP